MCVCACSLRIVWSIVSSMFSKQSNILHGGSYLLSCCYEKERNNSFEKKQKKKEFMLITFTGHKCIVCVYGCIGRLSRSIARSNRNE